VCLGQCAAALLSSEGEVLASLRQPMERGHAERLPGMVREALASADVGVDHVSAIVTTCGPGSFTGARLGVAFARGFALATGCEAVGLSAFDALAEGTEADRVLVMLDGRRNEFFVQGFEAKKALFEARSIAQEADAVLGVLAEARPDVIIGDGAAQAYALAGREPVCAGQTIDAVAVARAGVRRLSAGSGAIPKPLYLRAPDAKPARPLAPTDP